MASVRTTVICKSRTQVVRKQYEASARQIVGMAGNLVRNTAVDSINQGARSGAVYQRGGKNRPEIGGWRTTENRSRYISAKHPTHT